MAEIIVPDFVRKILNDICRKRDCDNSLMKFENGCNPGDGFTTNVVRVIFNNRNSSEKSSIFYKVAPENQNRRRGFNSDATFANEAIFYKKLMPIFFNIQAEKNVPLEHRFVAVPDCETTLVDDKKEQYAIFIEDLRVNDFQMWDRSKPCPIENVKLAMREIGKFHGISIAMKQQKPTIFDELKQVPDVSHRFLASEKMQNMLDESYQRAINLLTDHKDIYVKIRKNILARFEECIRETNLSVMSHGDFWTNNCVYKFEKGVAVDMRILDWQTLKCASPALDVVFHLFTATDKELRAKEYDNLIRLYYDSLANMVRLLGSNPDELFTFDNLLSELKRVGYYVLLVAPIYLQVAYANEFTNLDEMCDNMVNGGKQLEMVKELKGAALDAYRQRLNDVVADVVRMGYVSSF